MSDEDDQSVDDLDLYHQISPKERLDTILNAKHLSLPDAVGAMDALQRENDATFPHLVILSTFVSVAFNEPPSVWTPHYIGPFADRRAAESWGNNKVRGNNRLAFEVARIDTPEMDEEFGRKLRAIIDGEEPG